jgi:hypothetical protein
MSASIATLDSVLKNFYAKAIAEQLNQEVLMLELFEKAKLDWSGKRVVVPVHVARNNGVGFAAEGAALPTAGNQTYEELQITAKFLYGRFQLSGPAISSAKGAYSFGNYIDLELRKLVEDVRKRANVATFSGQTTTGWIHTRVGNGAAGALANSAGGTDIPFSGDASELERKRAAAVAAGGSLQVKMRRMSDYAIQNAGVLVTVTSVNTAANTVVLTSGAAYAVLTALRDDDCYAVEITGDAAALANANLEITGIATNLASGSHFGVDRTDATGVPALQSDSIRSVEDSGVIADYDTFQNLALERMQTLTDSIFSESGLEPDMIMMNPSQRASYTALLVGVTAAGVPGNLYKDTGSAGKGDGGFSGLGFNNIPIRVSVDAGKNMLYFLHTKAWKLAELEKAGFADLDGNILARAGVGTGGIDAYEGYFRMYCDEYCERPNANGALIGVSL